MLLYYNFEVQIYPSDLIILFYFIIYYRFSVRFSIHELSRIALYISSIINFRFPGRVSEDGSLHSPANRFVGAMRSEGVDGRADLFKG